MKINKPPVEVCHSQNITTIHVLNWALQMIPQIVSKSTCKTLISHIVIDMYMYMVFAHVCLYMLVVLEYSRFHHRSLVILVDIYGQY